MVIKQGYSVVEACLSRSDCGEAPGMHSPIGWVSLTTLWGPFFSQPCSHLLLRCHSHLKGCAFLSRAQNTLCLCMKACLAHPVLSRQLKQALSREGAGSLCWHSWKTFKGSEDSQHTGSQSACLPLPRVQTSGGNIGNPSEASEKLNVTPLVCHLSVWMHLVSLWWGITYGAKDGRLAGARVWLYFTPSHSCGLWAAFRWTLAPVFLSRNVNFISQSHDFHLSKTDMC